MAVRPAWIGYLSMASPDPMFPSRTPTRLSKQAISCNVVNRISQIDHKRHCEKKNNYKTYLFSHFKKKSQTKKKSVAIFLVTFCLLSVVELSYLLLQVSWFPHFRQRDVVDHHLQHDCLEAADFFFFWKHNVIFISSVFMSPQKGHRSWPFMPDWAVKADCYYLYYLS